METIVAAAIQYKGMTISLPAPARHHNIIRYMSDAKLPPIIEGTKLVTNTEDQGFITSTGRFVYRNEAEEIARAAGQVDELIGSILTSEDLW